MRNQGVGSWAARRARMSPDRVAVVSEDARWSYRQLHERATRLAHALAQVSLLRTGGWEGGLFAMIGRKPGGSA